MRLLLHIRGTFKQIVRKKLIDISKADLTLLLDLSKPSFNCKPLSGYDG